MADDFTLATATVEWLAEAVVQDDNDPGADPQRIPLDGIGVTLTPSPRTIEVAVGQIDGTQPVSPRTLNLRTYTLKTDANGRLVNPEDPAAGYGVQIVATDAIPGAPVHWTAVMDALDTGLPPVTKRFDAPTGVAVDLTTVESVPAAPDPLPAYLAAVHDARQARDAAVAAGGVAVGARDEAVAARDDAVDAADRAHLNLTVQATDLPAGSPATASITGQMPNLTLLLGLRPGQPDAWTTIGAGRPDLPATTPYTAAQLNALPVGHEYRSTTGPQGAWRWRKTGPTSWQCIDGDTGQISIEHLLVNGWTGEIYLRRVRELVHLIAPFASSQRVLNGANATSSTFLRDLPASWRGPVPQNYVRLGRFGSLDLFDDAGGAMQLSGTRTSSMAARTAWLATFEWPTTLIL